MAEQALRAARIETDGAHAARLRYAKKGSYTIKTGSLVVGIIGGLIVLVYGVMGMGMISIGDELTRAGAARINEIPLVLAYVKSVGLPLASLSGAGLVLRLPTLGASLMALVALVVLASFGFGFFTMIPILLLGVPAPLGFLGASEGQASPVRNVEQG